MTAAPTAIRSEEDLEEEEEEEEEVPVAIGARPEPVASPAPPAAVSTPEPAPRSLRRRPPPPKSRRSKSQHRRSRPRRPQRKWRRRTPCARWRKLSLPRKNPPRKPRRRKNPQAAKAVAKVWLTGTDPISPPFFPRTPCFEASRISGQVRARAPSQVACFRIGEESLRRNPHDEVSAKRKSQVFLFRGNPSVPCTPLVTLFLAPFSLQFNNPAMFWK